MIVSRCFFIVAIVVFVLHTHTTHPITSHEERPRLGIFCGAGENVSHIYTDIAYQLGQQLALNNYAIMTGGGKTGLMKYIVDGYVSQGSPENVLGNIPSTLPEKLVHPAIPSHNITWTDTVHQRLTLFQDTCDCFIVMPGGLGTVYELFDVLAHKKFGLRDTPVIIYEIHDFWASLLNHLHEMRDAQMLASRHMEMFITVYTLDECLTAAADALDPEQDAKANAMYFWQAELDKGDDI